MRLRVCLDCEQGSRHEAQRQGQLGRFRRGRNIGWTCEGFGGAATIAGLANKTRRDIGCELRHDLAARHDNWDSYTARLVDVGRVWWS